MNVLGITWKDLLIFLKDLGRVFTTFLLPLAFILAYGFAYSQFTGEAALVELPTVNLDEGGELAEALIETLNTGRGHVVKLYEEATAMEMVQNGELQRVLVIPAGFGAAVDAGQQARLRLISGPDAADSETEATYAVVDGAAKDLSLETQLLGAFDQMEVMMAGAPAGTQAFGSEVVVAQAESQFERSRTDPLVAVEQKVPEAILRERESAPGPMEIAVPGFTVLFCFLTAQATALAVYSEKKLGTFRRLLSAPLSKAEILGGKMLPNLIIVLVQVFVIFAVGVWLMPLLGMEKISVGNVPALAVVSLMVALSSTTLGVLIAALAKTESQMGSVAAIILWIAGALAGAFIPQFAMGDTLNTIGKVTPHYWAINAFTEIIVRGKELAQLTTQIGALALFAVVFFGIGVWRFKFD